jgi:ribosomal protein L11 methyltransferase
VKGLRAATTPIARVRGEYDLVFANIQADVLVPMAKSLIARLAPRGTLVLSGLLRPQLRDVAAAFAPLVLRTTTIEGEWGALVMGLPFERAKPSQRPPTVTT